MGQKTNPTGFRLAVRRNWQSRWYASKKDFPKLLAEDQLIRSKLMEKLKQASVPRIFIERASNRVRVKIYTAIARVLCGFIWAIGCEVMRQPQKLEAAA